MNALLTGKQYALVIMSQLRLRSQAQNVSKGIYHDYPLNTQAKIIYGKSNSKTTKLFDQQQNHDPKGQSSSQILPGSSKLT